nr:RNA-directed DNA polymerase, eukaryota [Tanacetum cinerariifolium]
MGSQRTKEDDVARISTSIFIMNFPETCSAKDLFNTCKQYGHVVDAFIPFKRSKDGKRFGFVRFINVFSVERLVSNSCMIWIDKHKLHANITRFQRSPVNANVSAPISNGGGKNNNSNVKVNTSMYRNKKPTGNGTTYVNAVKGPIQQGSSDSEIPALVLDNDCVMSKHLSNCLLGRVKEFASLANIKMTLNNEGFMNIKISYMGEMWVMMEFGDIKSMKLFRENVSVRSWFSQIIQASMDFVTKGRIAWVEIEGIPFKLWSGNTFKRIAAKWGVIAKETPGWVPDFMEDADEEEHSDVDSKDGRFKVNERDRCDDSDVEGVPDTLFEEDDDSVGNSGGILCVWNPNAFRKDSVTLSDYFILVRGVGRQNGMDFLIVVVYAPHDAKEKMMLWDYLTRVISRWKGKVVVMGDFNEVRYRSDSFEVLLGGCSFTWCHKSATKMSKLDMFLMPENFLNTYPYISAITLERFLKLVEDAWKESPSNETNAMLSLMGKLKFLKAKIRAWNKTNMASRKNAKEKYKIDLETVEGIIDSGNGNEELALKRRNLLIIFNKLIILIRWRRRKRQMLNGQLKEMRILVFSRYAKFSKPGYRRAILHTSFPKRLSTDQQIELESEVSNEEIKRAVWDCGMEKAPGPNGFTFGFYRQFVCNSSFIALIPKIPGANVVKDFRPISLIGSLYKIIAKILANRLVRKLGEIVNECKRKKKQLLVFKVDFEKAYDSVRWDFLDDILRKFGFGDKWCKWIQTCLRSSRGSIILNGCPTKEFQFYKGLKQGDPLSPFLFILVMESLHLSFQRVEEAGVFKGIKLDNSVSISHMFYADDVVFVGKYKLMGLHVDNDKIKRAASKLGCLTFKTPFMYLGSIVGGSMSRIQAWADVVDRVSSRYSKWKMNMLSISGRLTLLKSVLGSMPIFHMSIFKAPLDSWVNWKIALASKEKGGLGISSLYALNRGLMFKWFWRFCTQDTSLWSRVIKAIYGETGSVDGNVNSGFKNCWMNIVQEVNSLVGKGEFSVASVRCLIDDKTLPDAAQKTRWVSYVPIKVNVIAWKVKSNSLPTRFNISRRGIPLDSIKCGICDTGVETANHLFFSCDLVCQVVRLIARWWDVPYVGVESYADWVLWMENLRLSF